MTVEQVRGTDLRRAPARPSTPRTRTSVLTAPRSALSPTQAPLCVVVPEINEGDGANLVRSLRRRESTRAVLLTRRSGRREMVALLGGGVRGAVSTEQPGAVRITRTVQPGPELSSREIGVLRLVAEGRTNREIGEVLELSALTVKSHLARISRRIGIGDRAEMVAFAIRRNLLG